MKKGILCVSLALVVLCSSSMAQKIGIQEIFKRNFEWGFISRGDNLPDFKIKTDSMDYFLVCLHNDVSVHEFELTTGFSHAKTEGMIAFLESKGWLHKVKDKYKPTIFIATNKDGEKLFQRAKPLSHAISKKIEAMLPAVKAKFKETDIAKTQRFDEWAFFILSDVLLDNWQINNVESQFLGANSRPVRHGKHYYASINEANKEKESFGIYGNLCWETQIYGNNRYNVKVPDSVHFISSKDNKIFAEMAREFLPDMVKILHKNKKYCLKMYHELGYSSEITFEEFFIWWYHFIYTQTTDVMHARALLRVPEGGNFFYKAD